MLESGRKSRRENPPFSQPTASSLAVFSFLGILMARVAKRKTAQFDPPCIAKSLTPRRQISKSRSNVSGFCACCASPQPQPAQPSGPRPSGDANRQKTLRFASPNSASGPQATENPHVNRHALLTPAHPVFCVICVTRPAKPLPLTIPFRQKSPEPGIQSGRCPFL